MCIYTPVLKHPPRLISKTFLWYLKKKTWSLFFLVSLYLTFLPAKYFWIRTHVPQWVPIGMHLIILTGHSRSTFLNFCLFLHTVVTRASREGSEDPGWGGHVSDRKESPGALAEEELLQWRPSLFHGDSAKCDGHLQKSNLHPSSRRRAGKQSRWAFYLRPPPPPPEVTNHTKHAATNTLTHRFACNTSKFIQCRSSTFYCTGCA